MGILKKIVTVLYSIRMKFSKLTGLVISKSANKKQTMAPVNFYSLQEKTSRGEIVSFEEFRGKKTLLVNLASQCGFTPQYNELEELNQAHKDDLIILGFPSNDFGGQEPGTDEEIEQFCKVNFGITFQLMQKSHVVKGAEQNVVFQWLSNAAQNGWCNQQPVWNFSKYLINEDGELTHFFANTVSPLGGEVAKAIE